MSRLDELVELLDGRFAAQRIPGERPYQEDDYGLIGPEGNDRSEVLLLADGMGGHVSGDMASKIVVRTFFDTYPGTKGSVPDRLRTCLEEANQALVAAIAENPALKGMGSTVVAAVISPHGLDWISVGDSPLWLFRERKLRRLNADHSMAPVLADLVAAGRMTEEEAATDSQRHALRSAVMGDDIHLVDVSSQPVEVRQSDRVLLASDGLMTLADEQIADILQAMPEAPLAEVVAALIQAVEDVGHPHQDNTTILLYIPAADSEPVVDSGTETAPADTTAQAEPEPPTSASASTEHTPQAEPELREAIAPPSRKRDWLDIVLPICGFLLVLGLLGWWFLSDMQAGDMVVEPVPEPQEPVEQAGLQPPPSALAPKDDLPLAQPDSGQASGEGVGSAGTAKPAQPPGSQADSVMIPPSAQPDTGPASGEGSPEKTVKGDALLKPSAPSDTTAQ